MKVTPTAIVFGLVLFGLGLYFGGDFGSNEVQPVTKRKANVIPDNSLMQDANPIVIEKVSYSFQRPPV